MRRAIIFKTSCYQKVNEIKCHFSQYGIELFQETNKNIEYTDVINCYRLKFNLIAIIEETSRLMKSGTEIECEYMHLEDVEHVSELKVAVIKNNNIINTKIYKEKTEGYIDLYKDTVPAKFGWDNIFYLYSCHKNYVELDNINIKISSRDICVTKYIKEHIYYQRNIDLAHNPQNFNHSINFETEKIKIVLNNLIEKNPKMVDYGIAAIINYVYKNGIYFSSPINRRIKLNWCPGIVGLPLVRKEKDVMHEMTYMIHDFNHYAFKPDLIFTGIHSQLHYQLYIITRMMSEAITIIVADMLFVHSIIESGNIYTTVDERKIYPLFKQLNLNFNPSNNDHFTKSLRLLLQANVHYCLLGNDSYLRNLLKSQDENCLKFLTDYKNKYSQFFIQDYRWTQNTYYKMVEQSTTHKEWYKLVQQLNLKYQLNLTSIDTFINTFNIKNNTDISFLINDVFNHVFSNNVESFFSPDNKSQTICDNNLTKAFVRYMCNQLYIFEKFSHKPESKIFKDKIMSFLMSDSITKITPSEIFNIKKFYDHYLKSCYNENLITFDDLHTFSELYSIIDPFIVNYDTTYPESLDVVANKILHHRIQL